MNAWSIQLIGDPEVAKLYDTGLTDYEALDQVDRGRFQLIVSRQFRVFENIYYQHRHATLDREVWPGRRESMIEFLGHPGAQRWWRRRGRNFGASFRELVEQEIQDLGANRD